jgi:hypothetical protein
MTTKETENKGRITRKGFLGRIGAAVAAALTARTPARAAVTLPPPDVIKQADLQSVFDDLKAIETKILGFRRRILAGAKIEPGALSGYFTPGGSRKHLGTEEEERCIWDDFTAYGLCICPAEDAEGFDRLDVLAVPRVEVANGR